MNGTKIPPNFVLQLSSAKTSEAERHLLEELRRELLPLDTTCMPAVESEEDLFEKEFLTYAKATFDSDNPFPSKTPENLFLEEDDLNTFTCYLFERRYGWSEIGKDGTRRVRRLSCGGVLPLGSVEHKAIINDILDDFLKWYRQQPLTPRLLKACLYTLSQASNVPVVRNQAYIHLMEWFKQRTAEISNNPEIFKLVQNTVVSGVTDVWSAIRSACASRLGPVCAEFPSSHLYQLFSQLSQICQAESSPWQSVEGAVMGLNAVIKGFRWKELCEDGTSDPAPKGSCKVESNLSVLQAVSEQLKEVIYPLLSHPQLTIREHATRTLSSFLSRNQFQESLSCFEQVCQRLCQGTEPFLNNQKFQGVHHAALYPDYKFLDAYAAEGLLSVCLLLVKRIPVGHLVPGWPHYLSTFLLYLMHPASTVRQATSSVFKYILSRGSTNPVFVKLVISELVKDWTPDVEYLGQSEDSNFQKSSMARRSVTQRSEKLSMSELSSTWEWREGRLFAYELIMKFLIKNHWLYTFGAAGQSASTDRQANTQVEKEQAAREKLTRRISEVTLTAEGNDSLEKSSEYNSAPGPHKQRVMTSDALLANVKPSAAHGRPYPLHGRSHDPHGSSRSPIGLSSVFAQLHKLENTFSEVEGVYQNETAANEKQRSILLELVQNKEPTGWLCELRLEPAWCLLERMFYQVTECVVDSQWELRRMGIQTLPYLSELMRWYDMPQLVRLISSHLNTQIVATQTACGPSPLTYTAVLTLRDSLVHATGLQHLLRNPPLAWQEQERCKDAIVAICGHTQENVESYLPVIQQLLTRGSYDKLSVVAASVLKMAVSHFNLSKSQKLRSTDHVLRFWRRLFCLAHPDAHFTPELAGDTRLPSFKSPYTGYLSCCVVRPEGPLACAKQVYGVYMRECQGCLGPFVATLPPQDAAFLLPVLAHATSRFAGDPGLCKVTLDSLSHLSGLTVDSVIKDKCSFQRDGIRYIYLALKEITSQITSKTLDLQTVRRLLDIYLTLSKAIVLNKHLPTLLRAICARVNQSGSFMVQVSPRPADDLAILSNDIPPSTTADVESEDSDAEDTGPALMFPECFSLNMSNNSGSFASGRLSALSTHSSLAEGRVLTPASSVQSDGEQDSDWDSWSEEEEDASALLTLFTDFFTKLRGKSAGSPSIFSAEMNKLGEADRKLILTILGQTK